MSIVRQVKKLATWALAATVAYAAVTLVAHAVGPNRLHWRAAAAAVLMQSPGQRPRVLSQWAVGRDGGCLYYHDAVETLDY